MPGQHQLVPEIDEVTHANEPTDVVVVAFAKHLLVDTDAVLPIPHVINPRRTAPSDVKRQLDRADDLLHVRGVEVFRAPPAPRPWLL